MSVFAITYAQPPVVMGIREIFDNLTGTAQVIGGGLCALVGTLALIFAVFKTLNKFNDKQSQTSWFSVIGLYLFGGLCYYGGFKLFEDFASKLGEGAGDDLLAAAHTSAHIIMTLPIM